MNNRLHDKIRAALESVPGLTQKGLAERMGLNPAAVNRMLYGQRNIMAEEIPVIEDYLGIRLALSEKSGAVPEIRQDNNLPTPVPVYKSSGGGKAVDWVARHPAQTGIANAFAVYVASDAMEPRYFQGELVYIHPGRPPETNRDCLVILKSGIMQVRRFLRQDAESLHVAQFHPPQEETFSAKDVGAVYAVVGRG